MAKPASSREFDRQRGDARPGRNGQLPGSTWQRDVEDGRARVEQARLAIKDGTFGAPPVDAAKRDPLGFLYAVHSKAVEKTLDTDDDADEPEKLAAARPATGRGPKDRRPPDQHHAALHQPGRPRDQTRAGGDRSLDGGPSVWQRRAVDAERRFIPDQRKHFGNDGAARDPEIPHMRAPSIRSLANASNSPYVMPGLTA